MSNKSQEARTWLLRKLDDSQIILKMTCFDSSEISINADIYLRNKVMNFQWSVCTRFSFPEITAEQALLFPCFHMNILTYNSWGKRESNTVKSVIKDEVYLAVPKAQWRWLWSSFCWVTEWNAKIKQRRERNNRNYKTTSGRNRQRKRAWKRRIFLLLALDVSASQPTGKRECRKREKKKIQSGLTCTPTLPPCQGHTCYRTLQYSVCLAESHSGHEVHSGTWMVVLNDQRPSHGCYVHRIPWLLMGLPGSRSSC